MKEDEPNLNKAIHDCGKSECPLYSAFWDTQNAQAQYRIDHFKWSNKYKPQQFQIGDALFGAKLALIMESPPPKFIEYFYGPEGGFSKDKSLFKNVIFTLARIENKRNLLTQEKEPWLKWFASLGIVIIDAAKCRMKISDAFDTEKITQNEIKNSFTSCSFILEKQLRDLKPFRVAVGIASVYDHTHLHQPYIKTILSDLGMSGSFFDTRTVSLWDRRGPNEFLNWFENIWKQTKMDFENNKLSL